MEYSYGMFRTLDLLRVADDKRIIDEPKFRFNGPSEGFARKMGRRLMGGVIFPLRLCVRFQLNSLILVGNPFLKHQRAKLQNARARDLVFYAAKIPRLRVGLTNKLCQSYGRRYQSRKLSLISKRLAVTCCRQGPRGLSSSAQPL